MVCRAVAVGALAGLFSLLALSAQAQPTPPATSPASALPAAPASEPSTDPVAALRDELARLRRSVQAMAEHLSQQEVLIRQLQARLVEAPAAEAAAPEPPPPAPAPAPAPAPVVARGGGESASGTYFNPSISLIGNYLAVAGRNHLEPQPSQSLRESELGLQAIVDPYAKADVFFSYGEEGVEVEEGYVTFTKLPADLLVKVGRQRAAFGKVNTLHLHVLPWPDEPLTMVNLLGGEEGWVDTGISVAKLLPVGNLFTEATVQVLHGESGDLFAAPRRRDLAYNGHYRLFADLTESANLDVGLSYGYGHNGITDDTTTRLQGLDLTFRWKPLRTALYRALTLRGELITSQREGLTGTQHPLGWFVSGEYQFAKRWSAGARLESAERADDDRLRDYGEALLLTFSPSEFAQLRAELRRRAFAGDDDALELLLQLQFAIGAHGAHPF